MAFEKPVTAGGGSGTEGSVQSGLTVPLRLDIGPRFLDLVSPVFNFGTRCMGVELRVCSVALVGRSTYLIAFHFGSAFHAGHFSGHFSGFWSVPVRQLSYLLAYRILSKGDGFAFISRRFKASLDSACYPAVLLPDWTKVCTCSKRPSPVQKTAISPISKTCPLSTMSRFGTKRFQYPSSQPNGLLPPPAQQVFVPHPSEMYMSTRGPPDSAFRSFQTRGFRSLLFLLVFGACLY